jgi:hypothetical protein
MFGPARGIQPGRKGGQQAAFTTKNGEETVTTSSKLLASLLVFGVACGGGQKEPEGPAEDLGPSQPPTQDFVFQDYEEIGLEGQRFTPDAMPDPGMLRVLPKKAPSLAAARRSYQRAKDAKKQQELQILATVLWDESKKHAGTPKETELREEARTALREYRAANADALDEVTLQILGAHEIYADDPAAAAEVYEEIVRRFPDSKNAQKHAARLAQQYLVSGRLPDAVTLVDGWKVDDQLSPDAAYALGWTRFYQRRFDDARAALLHAAKGWAGNQGVETDIVLVNAYGVAPVDTASAAIQELAAPVAAPAAKINKIYYLTFLEAKAYEQAGQFGKAGAALDAAAAANPEMPDSDKVAFPSLQMDYYLRTDEPAKVADAALGAWEALAACDPAVCQTKQAQQQTLLDNMEKLALHFHTIYATSLDDKYYEPAMRLYDFYLQDQARPNHGKVTTYVSQLKETKANTAPSNGKHTKEMMGTAVDFRKQAFLRCYETVLQADPKLSGSVKVTIEIEHTGKVSGAQTEPAGGKEGMAAVAKCLDEEVRTWTFPGRSMAGKTVLVVPVGFSPKAAEAPAAAAPAPAAGGGQQPAEGGDGE